MSVKVWTIRRRFRRRMRVALLLCVVGAVVIAWSAKYGDLRVGSPGPLLPRAVPVLGMLVFCLGLLVSGTGRCPRCLSVVHPFIVFCRRCPACGIGLDERCS
ncbi:MAG TPA: hypothetical protein VFO23_09785 [Steroidobacteraceae bacterium]|nr:hypothetical protein [Steroidobacteraceae bacterium]